MRLVWLTDIHLNFIDADERQKFYQETDGRLGNYQNSRVVLNDSRMIADLFQKKTLGKYPLLEKMQQLADEDAKSLQR